MKRLVSRSSALSFVPPRAKTDCFVSSQSLFLVPTLSVDATLTDLDSTDLGLTLREFHLYPSFFLRSDLT